ncbi:hypothetical protein HK103_003848 [Boothiomyces macroporosus]|uniref:Uncharacterized protein n=1 Tax=Boothiomyces macroporosus TaxID=261099 RepID=A0AAD5UM94_9FUNG|nr:hypothetical protein HK103_003848 [Boothiomyces macroporosus]
MFKVRIKRKYTRLLTSVLLFMLAGFLYTLSESEPPLEIPVEDFDIIQYKPTGEIDFGRLGKALNTFSKYHDLIYQKSQGWYKLFYTYDFESQMIDQSLFPWLHTNSVRMRKSFKGNGIVMSVSDNYTEFALSTLSMIRVVHKCNLPVEIFYIGDKDLSESSRRRLLKIKNTKLFDLTKIFDNDIIQLYGWDSKPFALLASSFRNAMIIDADTVFLQSPSLLFKDPQFILHRALFFQDRKVYMLDYAGKLWIETILQDDLSETAKNYDILNWKSLHQQESGVVLIDKKLRLPGLLAACTLNMGQVKNTTYDHVHGDKETFWLGFEAVGANYTFNSIGAGVLGLLEHEEEFNGQPFLDRYQVCNVQILHATPTNGPIWMNGGIAQDKYNTSNHNILSATHFVNEPGEWQFSSKIKNRACLLTQHIPALLPEDILANIQKSGAVWREVVDNF